MISPKRRLSASIAVVLALGIAPVLSGCSGNPLENLVEQATGGQVDIGSRAMPDGFPAEVPVVSGDVLFGISAGDGEERGFNVTIATGAESPLDGIETQFADAGFEAQAQASNAGGAGSVIFSDDDWNVVVVVAETDDGFTANYTVSPAGS